jgi:hypothetical protein
MELQETKKKELPLTRLLRIKESPTSGSVSVAK